MDGNGIFVRDGRLVYNPDGIDIEKYRTPDRETTAPSVDSFNYENPEFTESEGKIFQVLSTNEYLKEKVDAIKEQSNTTSVENSTVDKIGNKEYEPPMILPVEETSEGIYLNDSGSANVENVEDEGMVQ